MPLQPGTTLGPSEIQGPLGGGGMGEGYKARDTRLDRTVAVKVLPGHVASDPDLKQRFAHPEIPRNLRQGHPFVTGELDGFDLELPAETSAMLAIHRHLAGA